jgi:plastocyanin
MTRSTWIVIIILAVLVVGGAVALTRNTNDKTNSNSTSTNSTNNSTSDSSTQNTSPDAATGQIKIANMAFTPSQISIKKGDTVTWTNNDSVAHTVVDDLSNVGGPNSGEIAPGTTYSFTFNNTGSFQYHCSIHPSMRGTIVVK